jgi:hypothetical protein
MAYGGWRRAQVVQYQFQAYGVLDGVPIMPQAKERFENHVRILLSALRSPRRDDHLPILLLLYRELLFSA